MLSVSGGGGGGRGAAAGGEGRVRDRREGRGGCIVDWRETRKGKGKRYQKSIGRGSRQVVVSVCVLASCPCSGSACTRVGIATCIMNYVMGLMGVDGGACMGGLEASLINHGHYAGALVSPMSACMPEIGQTVLVVCCHRSYTFYVATCCRFVWILKFADSTN